MKQFKNEIYEMFKDDWIRVGKKNIRPFSLAWWMILFAQCTLIMFIMYLFYVGMWIALG